MGAPQLVSSPLPRTKGGRPALPRRREGTEARAAPGAGVGACRQEPPRAGRRQRTGAGFSPDIPTPRGSPGAAALFPSLPPPSLTPSPFPTSPPKPQEPPRPPCTRSAASSGAVRAALAADTARSGTSPAASPPPHCHGRGRGPALRMLLGAPRAGGWDRGRVGERLQAALAGLQELQVLREQQRELVRAALAMPTGEGEQPLRAHSKELRLEATLTALKEQLVRDGTPQPHHYPLPRNSWGTVLYNGRAHLGAVSAAAPRREGAVGSPQPALCGAGRAAGCGAPRRR